MYICYLNRRFLAFRKGPSPRNRFHLGGEGKIDVNTLMILAYQNQLLSLEKTLHLGRVVKIPEAGDLDVELGVAVGWHGAKSSN